MRWVEVEVGDEERLKFLQLVVGAVLQLESAKWEAHRASGTGRHRCDSFLVHFRQCTGRMTMVVR